MTQDTVSTRRSLLKGGALLAAPLVAGAPGIAAADDGRKARLARLEDEAQIRGLHQAWLRRINAGNHGEAAPLVLDPRTAALDQAVRSIGADHLGEPDAIKLAADGARATGRFACVVAMEVPIARDCTLAQMAHAQGGGVVRRSERRVLEAEYVKAGGEWAVARIGLVPA